MATQEEINAAIKLLNENKYIVIPISNGQLCLCGSCTEPNVYCRYGAFGYTCSNLICINDFIKEQIDYQQIIADIQAE